jgi:hypothetical protein
MKRIVTPDQVGPNQKTTITMEDLVRKRWIRILNRVDSEFFNTVLLLLSA